MVAFTLFAFVPVTANGQETATTTAGHNAESLSLSITPPLVQLSIEKGQFWASTLRVFNPNSYPITVYGSVTDFRPSGNEGKGVFVPQSAARPNSLSEWTTVASDPVTIVAGGSGEIPFEVTIPEGADSGGHYAAILVGTRPVEDNDEGSLLRVSSFVSSLLFVRIEGDVHEDGFISSFFSDKGWYQEPAMTFSLSFKNTGNVHVRPEGEIAIETLRGRRIATLPFNDSGTYGSVLPEGVRQFEVPWEWSDARWYNFGRYRAAATLAFGHDARHNVSATTTFWYVPYEPLAWVGGGVVTLIVIVLLLVKISLHRALHGRRRVRRKRVPRNKKQRVPREKKRKKSQKQRIVHTPANTYPHRVGNAEITPKTDGANDTAVVDLRKQKNDS